MLESFTIETFAPLVGGVFIMHLDPATDVTLELVDAFSARAGPPPAEMRSPFSLVFRGPHEPVAVQRIYRLDHPTLGSFELFIVPVGPDDRGMRYEAVFT